MTPAEALSPCPPSRPSVGDVRRAAIADDTLGVDAFAPVGWLAGSGTNVADALIAWADAKLIEVKAGGAFDVVRMKHTPGLEAIRHLLTVRAAVGPVLKASYGVDILVPAGHAADWDLPGADALPPGAAVGFPHPAVVSPHECNARSWLVTPRDERALTDGADLYGAYAAALVSLGQPIDGEAV